MVLKILSGRFCQLSSKRPIAESMSLPPSIPIRLGHSDPLNYNPTVPNGVPKSSLNLRRLPEIASNAQDKIFQFDDYFPLFRKNKELCREENLEKYYQDTHFEKKAFCKHILNVIEKQNRDQFCLSHAEVLKLDCRLTGETLAFDPKTFEFLPQQSYHKYSKTPIEYRDALDAISMQVAEDIVLQSHRGHFDDYAASIHLCSPNHWAAEDAIDQPISVIHRDVPYIKKVISNDEKLIKNILSHKRCFERTGALNIYTDTILNKHPDCSYDSPDLEETLKTDGDLFFRFERQTISPIESHFFIFTIRTYFLNIRKLNSENRKFISSSFAKSPETINLFNSSTSNLEEMKSSLISWMDRI